MRLTLPPRASIVNPDGFAFSGRWVGYGPAVTAHARGRRSSRPACLPPASWVAVHDRTRVEVRTLMNGETLLVRGGLLADGTGATLQPRDVRVHGDRVVEIGSDLAVDGADVVDAGWQLVMPGFVDTHVHV